MIEHEIGDMMTASGKLVSNKASKVSGFGMLKSNSSSAGSFKPFYFSALTRYNRAVWFSSTAEAESGFWWMSTSILNTPFCGGSFFGSYWWQTLLRAIIWFCGLCVVHHGCCMRYAGAVKGLSKSSAFFLQTIFPENMRWYLDLRSFISGNMILPSEISELQDGCMVAWLHLWGAVKNHDLDRSWDA